MTTTEDTVSAIDIARAALRKHLDIVVEKNAAVRAGGDDEDLHDMRVASRRVRAAVRVFAPLFAPRALGRRKAELRALTAELGTAREWDVHVDNLGKERRSAANELEKAALGHALSRIKARRDAERAAVLAALDRASVEKLARRTLALVEGRRAMRASRDATLPGLARAVVTECIAGAWGEIGAYRETSDAVRLHELRIAMKKLRYALEVLDPAFAADPETCERVHDEAKEIQDTLGKHHDKVLLAGVLDEERRRLEAMGLSALAAGLGPAIERLRASAEKARREFLELTAGRTADQVRGELALALGP